MKNQTKIAVIWILVWVVVAVIFFYLLMTEIDGQKISATLSAKALFYGFADILAVLFLITTKPFLNSLKKET
jgi:hypothetical protein